MRNRQVRLVRRPPGRPSSEDFEVIEAEAPRLADGEVLVRNLYASMDPAMRGWMRPVRTYIEPIPIGGVMRALTVGEVVQSAHPDWKVGDYVSGSLGLQDYAAAAASDLSPVDPALAPLTAYCGGLGMTGQTAYFGMTEIARPRPGEVLLVSSAAGATGSVVGQIGKILGCRVVGIAGGPQKCEFLKAELGFDAAIDYRAGALSEAIAAECPDGVDIFFDNVGGAVLDAALLNLARNARVVLCGAISQAGDEGPPEGSKQLLQLAFKHAVIEGFVVFEYRDRFPQATRQLAAWLGEGRLKLPEQIETGLDRFPDVLGMLFDGQKVGKLVLKIAEDA